MDTYHKIYKFGDPDADILLIQMVDDHDMDVIEQEVSYIRELCGGQAFCLAAIKVNSWNDDLAPWKAPAVFGNEDFGDGAVRTLEYIMKEVIPGVCAENSAAAGIAQASTAASGKKIYIGGYSLAGLFALWAVFQTDLFAGCAAASPSIWFPGFLDYMKENHLQTKAVYLSLGDKEEKTRNPVMKQVGNAIRQGIEIVKDKGTDCILEWNSGNHFKEPDLRTAKAFAWLINRE